MQEIAEDKPAFNSKSDIYLSQSIQQKPKPKTNVQCSLNNINEITDYEPFENNCQSTYTDIHKFQNSNNDYINIKVNENLSNQSKLKSNLDKETYEKITSIIEELIEIDKVVPFCEEKNRKELLLDRGLLLCLHVDDIMKDYETNIEDIKHFKRTNNIEFDCNLLDENYWMNQKVDRYARTPQRQVIPCERWFMMKEKDFTSNLKKCFNMNRNGFYKVYNWLNSFNDNN